MNIFIITMDDPVQTKSFISKIIEKRKDDIVGLAISKGDRLTIQKNKSKYEYLVSLFLIMGFFSFLKNSLITVAHKIKKYLHSILPSVLKDPTVKGFAENYGIKTWQINTPNNNDFLKDIRELNIDVIINQSQNILKSDLLAIPRIGVINRHNALLPKNRGRLTPFWVLYKGEKESGVSIHFVKEDIDSGDIIVQDKFKINKNETFNSLVKRNYEIAPRSMIKALYLLESGNYKLINNDDSKATYNSLPTFKDALTYRISRIKNRFKSNHDQLLKVTEYN